MLIEEADISQNKLEAVPECFAQLKCLQILDLSANNIIKVNDSIHNMEELISLNLSANKKLEVLPDNFGLLKKIERLNLSKCNFSEVPEPVTRIRSLKTLLMSGNKIIRLRK